MMDADRGLDEARDRLRRVGHDLVWYGMTHLLCRGLEAISDGLLVVPTSPAGRRLCEGAKLHWMTPEEFSVHARRARRPLSVLCFEENEFLAGLRASGVRILRPPAPVVARAADKVILPSIAMAAGVASIPSITFTAADPADAPHLAERLGGDDWVLQLPENNLTGRGTFRASSVGELADLLDAHGGRRVKVAPFVYGIPLTVSACVHPRGTIVSYLSRQLIGVPELTSHWAAHCGNDIVDRAEVNDDAVEQIRGMARRIGDELRKDGFLGCFGLDLLLDPSNGARVVEINPRFQSVSSIGLVGEMARRRFPLAVWHVLSFLEPDLHPPSLVDSGSVCAPFGQIIAEHQGGDAVVGGAMASGAYALDAAGMSCLTDPNGRLTANGELMVTSLTTPGDVVAQGSKLFYLQTAGRVSDDRGLRPPLADAVRHFTISLGLDCPPPVPARKDL